MHNFTAKNESSLQEVLEKFTTGKIISSILSDPRKFWIVFLISYLTLVQIAELPRSLNSEPHGDIKLYERVIRNIYNGQLPYKDFQLEYPPYAILFFILPSFFSTTRSFQTVFGVQILIADILVKFILLIIALKLLRLNKCSNQNSAENSEEELLPLSLFYPVLVFSLITAPNHYFYLQRYDLFPALISLLMLFFWLNGNYLLSGILLMFGAGIKLYPLLFLLPMLVASLRIKRHWHFITGLFIGALPLIILSFFMPWWKFMEFHAGRGLQCESIWAGVVWLLKLCGVTNANWTFTRAWVEVTGPLATSLLPYAKFFWLSLSAIAVIIASLRIWRSAEPASFALLNNLLLGVLLIFVSFNIVLSPQYLIWIAVFTAISSINRFSIYVALPVIAAIVTPILYPGLVYGSGFEMIETIVLFIRNGFLIFTGSYILFNEAMKPLFKPSGS
ncbi:MAG: glycosyltransferase 87 family protein [Verrucomicrobiia bacterium]